MSTHLLQYTPTWRLLMIVYLQTSFRRCIAGSHSNIEPCLIICREGVKRNFELAQGKAAELGTLPEMMSSAAFADFGPDRRAMVRTTSHSSHPPAQPVSPMPPLILSVAQSHAASVIALNRIVRPAGAVHGAPGGAAAGAQLAGAGGLPPGPLPGAAPFVAARCAANSTPLLAPPLPMRYVSLQSVLKD